MATIFAVTKLFDDVVAQFAADGTNVPNVFGWREPTKQQALPRVVWVPGNDANGDIGEIVAGRFPGKLTERALGNIDEIITVYVQSVDATNLENERAQYESTRALFDAWYRAVYLNAHGTFEIQSAEWVIDKKERRFGAAIRVLMSVQAVLPDEALVTMPVDTAASITTTLAADIDPPVDVVDENTPDIVTASG